MIHGARGLDNPRHAHSPDVPCRLRPKFESWAEPVPYDWAAPGGRRATATRQQEEGSVLIAIGYSDSCSLYIGESTFLDATGAESIIKSDKVIGGINTLKGRYGCQHKGTITRRQYIFFYFYIFSKNIYSHFSQF